MNNFWDIIFGKEAAEELLSSVSITMSLELDVQHRSIFIDGPPQPMGDTADIDVHFVQMPPGTTSWFPVTKSLGELISEFDAPGANGFA